MSDQKEIIRAGCFKGDKIDPKSLCQVPDCRLATDCIWKKVEVSSQLGTDNNKTEAMPKIR